MAGSITFRMYGFNRSNGAENVTSKITLEKNQKHRYESHPCISSIYIDDNFSMITFELKAGCSPKECRSVVCDELGKICFNIISKTEIPTFQPICEIEAMKYEDGSDCEIEIHDNIKMRDSLLIERSLEADSVYKTVLNEQVEIAEHKAEYKDIFYILHNPHRIVQYVGLYDIMAEMIHSPIRQNKVHDFFGKNRERYPFVEFRPSRKDPKKKEDSFTFLRNTIAHSKQEGIAEFLSVSQNISETDIRRILIVINDLICGNVNK
jgi:hypothetical protein